MNNKLSPSNLNECWVMSIIINFRILDQEKCLKQHITFLRQVNCFNLSLQKFRKIGLIIPILELMMLLQIRVINGKNSSVIHIQALVMLKYIQLILYLKLLGSFRSRFVSEYDRKVTANAKKSRDQTPAVTFAVHVWTSSWEVTGNRASSTLFVFLVESSHMCPIIMGEVRSFLHNHSVWDARKQIFFALFCVWNKGPLSFVQFKMARTC